MTDTRYELWDMHTDALVASYDDNAEAWAAIVQRAQADGPKSLERLALVMASDVDPIPDLDTSDWVIKIVLATGTDMLSLAEGNIAHAQNPRPDQVRTPKSERNLRRLRLRQSSRQHRTQYQS